MKVKDFTKLTDAQLGERLLTMLGYVWVPAGLWWAKGSNAFTNDEREICRNLNLCHHLEKQIVADGMGAQYFNELKWILAPKTFTEIVIADPRKRCEAMLAAFARKEIYDKVLPPSEQKDK